MFDVLTYEKGASVLRMLEQRIGPTIFRDGVRDYLHAHAYGNADTKTSGSLWERSPVSRYGIDGWLDLPAWSSTGDS